MPFCDLGGAEIGHALLAVDVHARVQDQEVVLSNVLFKADLALSVLRIELKKLSLDLRVLEHHE